jgi:hypothetical protein
MLRTSAAWAAKAMALVKNAKANVDMRIMVGLL